MRSGTLAVPGIVGLGKACELVERNLPEYLGHMRNMRDRLEAALVDGFLNLVISAKG